MHDIIQGNCLEVLTQLEDNSIDSIVTDPPYELGFMGKAWDNTGIANNKEMWSECLRVLKPGGHLLAFSGTRTYHRMASAIEDAGFEVRDMIEWMYGSGFPKSLNIGKAVDKIQGNKREVTKIRTDGNKGGGANTYDDDNYVWDKPFEETKGTSEWEGWGTALKPAHEPICMARKPLSEKTVAENVLKYGTGGINIDESRVGYEPDDLKEAQKKRDSFKNSKDGYQDEFVGGKADDFKNELNATGRFPANLIHDNSEEVRECFPETKDGGSRENTQRGQIFVHGGKHESFGGEGNASRYFKSIIYTAKASKSERNKGCEELEENDFAGGSIKHNNLQARCSQCNDRHYDCNGQCSCGKNDWQRRETKNNHPTVKPIALMEYLIKMVTPKGGIVLDPFAGSGSTLVAAKQNGFQYIGIELDKDYCIIAKSRLKQKILKQEVLF